MSSVEQAEILTEDRPVLPPSDDQSRLLHNALSVPLNDKWLELRNSQEAAGQAEPTELDLLRDHHIRLGGQLLALGKPADDILDVLLRLPAGRYLRQEISQALQALDPDKTRGAVNNRMSVGLSVLRNVQAEVGPLVLTEAVVEDSKSQTIQLLGGLVVCNLRGDETISLEGASRVSPVAAEELSLEPIQLDPTLAQDEEGYKKSLSYRKRRVIFSVKQKDIRFLHVNTEGELTFCDTKLDLNEVERLILDIFMRSHEPQRAIDIRVTLADLGIELDKEQFGRHLANVIKKTMGARSAMLIVKTGRQKGMRYGLNPAVIIDDARIEDEQRQPAIEAMIDMIEAYIMEGSEQSDGRPTGFFEPELTTPLERTALMQVFKRLDLAQTTNALKNTPLPPGLSQKQRAEREAKINHQIEQIARRDALASRLYGEIEASISGPKKLADKLGIRPQLNGAASCQGVDPDLFYPERGESTKQAKAVCRGCEVREDCLEYALVNGEKFGIWGGLSERERRRLRRQRKLIAVAAAI
jgi:WhiB family redox-sensing transcriptional regulator